MVWVGKDLIDHLVPTPLPWAGKPSTKTGCSKLCPTWPNLDFSGILAPTSQVTCTVLCKVETQEELSSKTCINKY